MRLTIFFLPGSLQPNRIAVDGAFDFVIIIIIISFSSVLAV